MYLKVSSVKWWPFCPGGDELSTCYDYTVKLLQIWLKQNKNYFYEIWNMGRTSQAELRDGRNAIYI